MMVRSALCGSWAVWGLLASTWLSAPARADNECGGAVDGVITCTGTGNPYSRGIVYLDQASGTTLRVTSDAHVDGVGQVYSEGVFLDGRNGPLTADIAGSINQGGVTVSAISGAANITAQAPIFGSVIAGTEGAPSTVVVQDVTVTADGRQGVVAVSPEGPAALMTGPSDASVTVNGTVLTSGGPVYINRYETDTATGVRAGGDGSSRATINGSVQTTGVGAFGVSVGQAEGGQALVRGDGSVITSGAGSTGVWASSSGITSVQIGSVTTSGPNAPAIDASIYEPYPHVASVRQVLVEAGIVTTSGVGSIGIAADNPAGDTNITLDGTLRTSGDASTGILATSGEGYQVSLPASTSVTAHGDVVTAGANADGIVANATIGASDVAVGNVAALGAGSRAVAVTAATGAIVTIGGAVRSGSADAAVATGETVAVTVLNGASVTGGDSALALNSRSSSSVINAGSISGGTGPAITAAGGAVTIINRGTLSGRLTLTGAADSVENDGLFVASGTSDFGGGGDTFINAGTFFVLPATSKPGSVAFANLDRLTNSGTVDLRNGHVGDVLSMSGNFIGTGASTLGIDVDFAHGTSDRLAVAGAITGSTLVRVDAFTGMASGLGSIVFATGGEGGSGQAFTLASTGAGSGNLFRYSLGYSAGTNSYSLVVSPGDAVFRALKISEGANALWQRSADGWSAHMTNLRDAQTAGEAMPGGIWGSMTGSTVLRRDDSTFTSFGESRAVALSYRQDSFGGQLGADLGSAGPVRFGVTGGYLNSQLSFRSANDHVRFDAANLGAYASARAGAMFVNLLGKYDHYWADAGGSGAAFAGHFQGNSYGVKGEIGAHLGNDRVFAEPILGLAYTHTDLSSLRPEGTLIDFDGYDGLQGEAGARIGAALGESDGARVSLYGEGDYMHEFKGQNGIAFTGGATTLAYQNERIGDYGEGKLGLSVTKSTVTAFVEGFGAQGRDLRGGGGRAGVLIHL